MLRERSASRAACVRRIVHARPLHFCRVAAIALLIAMVPACGIKGPLKPPPASAPPLPGLPGPAPAPNAPAPAQEPPPPAPPRP